MQIGHASIIPHDKLNNAKKHNRPIFGSEAQECLHLATDIFKLVQVLYTDLSSVRRANICGHIQKDYLSLCKDDNQVTDLLLGDDLEQRVSNINKTKNIAKKITTSTMFDGVFGLQLPKLKDQLGDDHQAPPIPPDITPTTCIGVGHHGGSRIEITKPRTIF